MLGTVRTARSYQQQYVNSVKSLYGDLNNAQQVADDIYSQMAASGLSQEAWKARETARNKATQQGNGFLSDCQANVLGQVGSRYDEVQNLQGKITQTEGTHQAMQLMNSLRKR